MPKFDWLEIGEIEMQLCRFQCSSISAEHFIKLRENLGLSNGIISTKGH